MGFHLSMVGRTGLSVEGHHHPREEGSSSPASKKQSSNSSSLGGGVAIPFLPSLLPPRVASPRPPKPSPVAAARRHGAAGASLPRRAVGELAAPAARRVGGSQGEGEEEGRRRSGEPRAEISGFPPIRSGGFASPDTCRCCSRRRIWRSRSSWSCTSCGRRTRIPAFRSSPSRA